MTSYWLCMNKKYLSDFFQQHRKKVSQILTFTKACNIFSFHPESNDYFARFMVKRTSLHDLLPKYQLTLET